jgi:hypothetical protein
MAKTLSNFLVGIGVKFNDKGAKQAQQSLDSMRKSALQAGAAVTAAFGAKSLTLDTSNRVRQYQMLSEQIDTTTNSLYALDRAYQRAGGGAGELSSQLTVLKQLSASRQTGDLGWVEGAARAGINVDSILGQNDPVEIYRSIIKQLEGMSATSRINAINALGLSPVNINIAKDGIDQLDKQIAIMRNRRPLSGAFIEDSEQFQQQWFDMWDNIGSITDVGASKIIPKVNTIMEAINSIFKDNRDEINETTANIFSLIADNLGLVAAAGAALSASGISGVMKMLGKTIPAIGGAAAGVGAVASGISGIAAALGAISIVSNAGEGGSLSATSLFGDNAFTRFLDDPHAIDKMFSGTTITPDQASKASTSYSPHVVGASTSTSMGVTSSAGSDRGGQTKMLQPVTINLDGAPFKNLILELLADNEEQMIKDIRSPIAK